VVNITRSAGGICLNSGHREYLLDERGERKAFFSKKAAVQWLKVGGITQDEINTFRFPVVRGEK
jgi:hypothetical protein